MSVPGERHPVNVHWLCSPLGLWANGRCAPSESIAMMLISPLRIDHVGLLRDDRRQDFLLFALRYIEVVERAGNLRSNLVELF
jgi:hypothetical protein